MLRKLREFDKDYEDNQRLSLFIGTLQRFNGDKRLLPKQEAEIETYFSYRWKNNKN